MALFPLELVFVWTNVCGCRVELLLDRDSLDAGSEDGLAVPFWFLLAQQIFDMHELIEADGGGVIRKGIGASRY